MKKLFLFFILLATVAIGAQAQTFGQMCCPGIELRYQIQADQKSVALVGVVLQNTDDEDFTGDLVIPERVTYDPEEWVESDSEENDLDDDCEGIKTPIFRIPENRAEFPGGMNALKEFLATNCHYPPNAREGRWQGCVMLEFVVEIDGRISCIKVLRSVVSFLDEEAIRVVKAMPKWKPGQNYGQPCRSYFQLPVAFWLE